MKGTTTRVGLIALAGVLLFAPGSAHALTNCKAVVRAKDGVILVKANTVTGQLLWGPVAGQETNAFFNEASCDHLNGTWSQCTLGDPVPPAQAAITPPPTCFIALRDQAGAGAQCTAYVKKCTPGIRGTADLSSVSNEDSGMTVRFTGVNVQIVDGSGGTDGATNGKGNLIIGYNEDPAPPASRTGSHNLVVGKDHTFTSHSGVVGGFMNSVTAAAATAFGVYNTASGYGASVSGGYQNVASNYNASVSGGRYNTASANSASVSGGAFNEATYTASSVSGGENNGADGYAASISGGRGNGAVGDSSSISGGDGNSALSSMASVSGGQSNTAAGLRAWVGGGYGNQATNDTASISGGSSNTASGFSASVSGGNYNVASGSNASVSGGDSRTASGTDDWRGGLYFSTN